MSKPTVYIESTIPSFYYEIRTEPEMLARRLWTREWWDEHRTNYDVVTSDAVIDELTRGTHPIKDDALALVDSLELLSIEPEIAEIVEAYIEHKVMPSDPLGDALYPFCDFVVHRASQAGQPPCFLPHLRLAESGPSWPGGTGRERA